MLTVEEEKLGKIYDAQILKRLLRYLEKDTWMIVAAGFFGFILMICQIVIPVITQRAIDRYIWASARLLYLTTEQVEKHREYIFRVEPTTYAVPQEFLSKIENRRFADDKSYYIMNLEKADNLKASDFKILEKMTTIDEKPRGDKLQSTPPSGKQMLIISHEQLSTLDRKAIFFLRSTDWHGLIKLSLLFMAVMLVRFAAQFGQFYLTTVAGQRSMHRLRAAVFSHIQRLSVSFFDRNPVGRLVTRLTNDVEALTEFFSEVITSFFYDAFMIIGLIIYLPFYNWRLALVTFALLPPMVVATIIFRTKIRDAFRKVRVRLARINAFLNENLLGIKVVQIFGQENKRQEQFDEINESLFEARFSQMMIFAAFRPFVQFLSVFAIAVIIWSGAGWVLKGWITIGLLAAFISFAERFFEPINELTEKFNLMQQAMASGERIFMLLDEPQEQYTGRKLQYRLKGDIEFRNVWFAYTDDDWVLKDISFKIEPGERVAIVGATGAGKTSLINLLCRFYEINRGEILVDNKDIHIVDKKDLRGNMGLVMQDVFLFLGDIKTNIKLRSEMPIENVVRASQAVNAHDFIARLPDSYQSKVAERGANLSVGERQLIAFARAIAFDPAILVLDEATASVDTKTEALIQDAIHTLLEARTALVIAHRLSTVKDADRIIVLDRGQIVETGKHESLMHKKGVYFSLYKLQSFTEI